MKLVELGCTGIRVSSIVLGTWQFGSATWGYGKGYSERDCMEAVWASVEAGVNLIDTAEVYGLGVSEQIIGKALKGVRDEVLIATKVAGHHLTYDGVLKACERSLNRLGLKTIDLYQIHFPNPLIPIGQTMKAMEKLVKDGKIRYIGVSNFSLGRLIKAREALKSEDVVSNQVRYNLLQRQIEKELLPYCLREKITILAYSPLAQGVLTGKYNSENLPKDLVRTVNPLFSSSYLRRAKPLLDELRRIAADVNATMAQVALAWLVSKPYVAAIAGAKNKQQALENAAAGKITLTDKQIEYISSLSEQLRPNFLDGVRSFVRVIAR
ncbi:MAG: aldo/keto reductase [Candidatus Caldarchaeum sp.]|nr:aldo/keto reductase [Candidatus Caldarchaeum sp.]